MGGAARITLRSWDRRDRAAIPITPLAAKLLMAIARKSALHPSYGNAFRYRIGRPGVSVAAAATIALASMP